MMMATPALSSAPSKRRAVGGDDRPPAERLQAVIVGHADDAVRVARQRNIAAGIVLDHLRLDAGPGRFRRGVQVGAQGDSRRMCGTAAPGCDCGGHVAFHSRGRLCYIRGRHGRQHDAVLVLPGVGNADGLKLLDQQPPEIELARRTGIFRLVLAGRGVDPHVTQETLKKSLSVHGFRGI